VNRLDHNAYATSDVADGKDLAGGSISPGVVCNTPKYGSWTAINPYRLNTL